MRHLLLIAPLLASLATAATVEVRGNDELAKALKELKDGTTLKIHGGDYRGGWSVKGVDHLTVEGADPKNPPHFKGGNQAWHFSECSKLAVRHLRISGQKHNGFNIDDGGKLDLRTQHILLEHLQVSDIGPKGNFDGIKCSGIKNLTIRHCTISGWGGQAIDFVGCHEALISHCTMMGKQGHSQATGPQFKGGCSDVTIEHCFLMGAGMRPIQAGGSTGMAFFRPKGAKYEARRITIRNNTIVGGTCAVAFTGVDGAEFSRNIVAAQDKWVMRILQETTAEGFPPCRNVHFHHNLIVFDRSKVRGVANIGPNTAAETFRFESNLWHAADQPARSKPKLPSPEKQGIYDLDPKLDLKTWLPTAPRAKALLAG